MEIAHHIRELMENRGLKKLAGCHSLVVDGLVHGSDVRCRSESDEVLQNIKTVQKEMKEDNYYCRAELLSAGKKPLPDDEEETTVKPRKKHSTMSKRSTDAYVINLSSRGCQNVLLLSLVFAILLLAIVIGLKK